MRGAGLRLDNDVRRVWQCAACGAERKVGAQVTTVRCQCAGRPAMKLIEAMRRERPLKELSSPYLEFVFEPGEATLWENENNLLAGVKMLLGINPQTSYRDKMAQVSL